MRRRVHLAAVVLALASCWRGAAPEPAATAPAPVTAAPVKSPRAKGTTRPSTGPSLTSFSPGPLTLGHAAWDTDDGCMQCHISVGSHAPVNSQRCLGCHDHGDVAARIATRQGLHASALFAGKPCETCHREHRGRAFDNLGWQSLPGGAARFDHALTGWPLPAAYQQRTCVQCHTRRNSAGRTLYLGLDRAQFP